MADALPPLQKRSFDSPDEVRKTAGSEAQFVSAGGVTLMRLALQPGWRWTADVQPVTHTNSCRAFHVAYILSGRLHVRTDGGDEEEFGAGDVAVVPPGHDAWVVGSEPCVCLDAAGGEVWARPLGAQDLVAELIEGTLPAPSVGWGPEASGPLHYRVRVPATHHVWDITISWETLGYPPNLATFFHWTCVRDGHTGEGDDVARGGDARGSAGIAAACLTAAKEFILTEERKLAT
jgi:mannose-6-phosphate isomerase-like protein (cupin superfamily)